MNLGCHLKHNGIWEVCTRFGLTPWKVMWHDLCGFFKVYKKKWQNMHLVNDLYFARHNDWHREPYASFLLQMFFRNWACMIYCYKQVTVYAILLISGFQKHTYSSHLLIILPYGQWDIQVSKPGYRMCYPVGQFTRICSCRVFSLLRHW